MAFEKTVPVWNAPGSEPPASLKNSGFQPGYKPPADYFNWFWSGMSEAVRELQNKKPFAHLGTNPITSVADDTTSKWANLGSGYAWYSTGGQLENQPSNYGLLLNYVPNAYEVTQIWKCHSSGAMWIRSGNQNGWGQTWAKVYDSLNKPTANEVGAAPVINAETEDYDMDAIIASGDHTGFYATNAKTLGTPYKKGASTYTEALVMSYGSSATYGMQIAFISGGHPMIRYLYNGTLSDWIGLSNASQIIDIAHGGTGTDNAEAATKALMYKGVNAAPAEDLPTSYPQGLAIYYESSGSKLPYKPYNYGYLFHFRVNSDSAQLWFDLANGKVYKRTGNVTGWNASQTIDDTRGWEFFYTNKHKPSLDDLGAASKIHASKHSKDGTDPISPEWIGATPNYLGDVDGETYTFNSALQQGEYSVTCTSGTIEGQPSITAPYYGKLLVYVNNGKTHNNSNNWIWQVYYSTVSNFVAYRSKVNNSVWSSWQRFYTENYKPTPADIGAVAANNNLIQYVNSQLKTLGGVDVGAPRIEVGTYTGNGNTGSGNMNTLTFSFQPILVFIKRNGTQFGATPWIYGHTLSLVNGTTSIDTTWRGNKLSWYTKSPFDNPMYQLNEAGYEHTYIAIG